MKLVVDGEGWLKALETAGHAPRKPSGREATQDSLFPYWLGLPG